MAGRSKKGAKVYEYGRGKSLRWRVVAENGKNLANGGQAYSRDIDRDNGMLETAQAILAHFINGRRGK
jgi:hypothetical protein